MNDLVASPFGGQRALAHAESAGARQAQSRELAETQTKYLMAQRFPRDVVANMDKILNAFTRVTLAEKASYQFARGGTDITGPSIRAAEAIAQQWGNMETGFRELDRGINAEGRPYSEVEAYCLDLESRTGKRLQFIVVHWRDTRNGGYALKDERDIYELVANQAQRRVRACILAMIPGDVTEAAMQQVERTLTAKADTSPEALAKMVDAFAPFGVTKEMIEKRIQRRLDTIRPAQVVSLKRIYASLRDDMSEAKDWFEIEPPAAADDAPKTGAAGLKAAVKRGSKKEDPAAAPKPEAAAVTPAAATSPAAPAPAPGPAGGERTVTPELTADDYVSRVDNAADEASATQILGQAKAALSEADYARVTKAFQMAWQQA